MSRQLSITSTFKLKSGFDIPLLGYGVFQTPPSQTTSVVLHALKTGYRHVDSAAYYRNESAAAAGLQQSKIPRSQLFFTSKVPPSATTYDAAKRAISQSMKEVEKGGQLGYIDLMLIHSPYGGKEGRLGVWKALVEAVERGEIRSIGVSNYGVQHLEELETYIQETDRQHGPGKGGVLSVNQIELHPWLQRRDIIEWCNSRGVLVEAWAPLAQANRWGDKLLQDIVKRTGKTEAQVLLRWSLQMGFSPLPKSVTPSRIDENANVYDFDLSKEEMTKLETDEYDYHGWDPTTSGL